MTLGLFLFVLVQPGFMLKIVQFEFFFFPNIHSSVLIADFISKNLHVLINWLMDAYSLETQWQGNIWWAEWIKACMPGLLTAQAPGNGCSRALFRPELQKMTKLKMHNRQWLELKGSTFDLGLWVHAPQNKASNMKQGCCQQTQETDKLVADRVAETNWW